MLRHRSLVSLLEIINFCASACYQVTSLVHNHAIDYEMIPAIVRGRCTAFKRRGQTMNNFIHP